MAQHTISFSDDLPGISKYFADRVRAQSEIDQPISAIELGMKLCQRGFIGINFDVLEHHKMDVSRPLKSPKRMPHWSKALMQSEKYGIRFIMLNGKTQSFGPGVDERAVAGVFGKALLLIVRDAKARKVFQPLRLRDDCQLDITEFDWMWEWPGDAREIGKKNLFRRLRAARLPR